MRTIERVGTAVRLVDQTRLPLELVTVTCTMAAGLCDAIRTMRIRGAPALGVAAAYAMALGSEAAPEDPQALEEFMSEVAAQIRATRPTAINLFSGVNRALEALRASLPQGTAAVRSALWEAADALAEADIEANHRIGEFGAELLVDGSRILTHCNAGALATVGWGTALGVIRSAVQNGKRLHVFVDETRPFLQGARLTAWELAQEGIPYTVIADNMAGHLMARGEIDACIVGADRIAASGDVANKIGTYTVAILANVHGLPFYVAAPTSTIDLTLETGAEIPIEERDAEEVLSFGGVRVAPASAVARHPAFDVTPAHYVSAIITEVGVLAPPYEAALSRAVHAAAERTT